MRRVWLVALFLVALFGVSSVGAGAEVAATGLGNAAPVADPGRGLLLGTSGEFPTLLLSIDPGTGVGTVIGPMFDDGTNPAPFPMPSTFDAMATDPVTGFVYASGVSFGGTAPQLVVVDPLTGLMHWSGSPASLRSGVVAAFDFRADGKLFAAVHNLRDAGEGAADHLITINVATGVDTIMGPFGECEFGFPGGLCTIEGIETLAFDSIGTLWAAKANAFPDRGASGLYLVNPVTGAATFVTSLVGPPGFGPSGGLESLQFGCSGRLFGGTGAAIGVAQDGGFLVSVNRATGVVTPIGATPATPGGDSLASLSFTMSGCSPRQTLAAMTSDLNALVAVGALKRGALGPLPSLLRNAVRAMDAGNVARATSLLHRVVAVTQTLVGPRERLSPQTGNGLIAAAQRVLNGL